MGWLAKANKVEGKGGLGFRDIHDFNIAILPRQVWLLIEQPHSLCAQLVKAKYYPDCSILDAGQSSNMSYAWRSITYGIDLVK